MTRRLIRESDPPAGQLASPVPQYWNPNTEAFEDVLGAHGAPRAILYGPNGQPIGSSNPLPVADSALAQAVAQLATEGKLEEARALLETISQKDFATQTTLSEVLQRLEAIEEQLETGDAKVQLKGQIAQLTPNQTMSSVAADTWVTLFDFELTPEITSVYPYVFVVVDSTTADIPMTFRIVRSGWWTTGGGYREDVNREEFFTTSKSGISPTIPVKAVRAIIQVRLDGGSKSIRPVIMGSKHYLDFNYAGVSE